MPQCPLAAALEPVMPIGIDIAAGADAGAHDAALASEIALSDGEQTPGHDVY